MHHVPKRWQSQLDEYASQPRFRQFPAIVRLQLPDGSSAFFRHAFYLIDRDFNEIAVFSEHCGYKYLPLFDASIELLDSIRGDVGM